MNGTHVVTGLNPGQANILLFVSCSRHAIVLHYTKNYCTEVVYFSKIYNHTSLYDPIVSGANVDPTSQVRSSAMLVLLLVVN
jgi:hypothetical protein